MIKLGRSLEHLLRSAADIHDDPGASQASLHLLDLLGVESGAGAGLIEAVRAVHHHAIQFIEEHGPVTVQRVDDSLRDAAAEATAVPGALQDIPAAPHTCVAAR